MRLFAGLCVALATVFNAPLACAQEKPGIAVTVDVTHVDKDRWRVDYRFAQPVAQIKLYAVGDYRKQAWTVRTPGLTLKTEGDDDLIAAGGKPFKSATVEITTFDGVALKAYAPFNRFTDGGSAIFLGHLQGDASAGKQTLAMRTDIHLKGLAQENVIAPPLNQQLPGGDRGYAYFGPAQAVTLGAARFLIDPNTPAWARETVLDTGAKMSQYYASAYQHPLKQDLFIMVSVAGFEAPGLSLKGGAVKGQLSYRIEGKNLLGDSPRKRDLLARIVAHEMAHVWQLDVARGGVGEDDPWIHEGGAEAMALDGLQQTGIVNPESIVTYRTQQLAACDKLGNTVDSYEGIYACGLARFDKLGVPIVPLWRAMMQATEAQGAVYSQKMIDAIAAP